MDPEFWKERWQARQIGFNLPKPHDYLVRHGAPLWQSPSAHVFVPLCGKSIDMAYLAEHGAEVTGAELVESAAQESFSDLGAKADVSEATGIRAYSAAGLAVRILVGNFFDLNSRRPPTWSHFDHRTQRQRSRSATPASQRKCCTQPCRRCL